MSRQGLVRLVHVGLFAGAALAAASFWAGVNQGYIAGIALILMGAVGRYVLDSTAPDPKNMPAPALPGAEDRARWSEAPLTGSWPGHTLCDRCEGSKLCPQCGGSGGCEACDDLCWCASCGGAGQWPEDPTRAIYTPAPAERRAR